MIARKGRTGGEFHIDGCIEDALALGLNCVAMDVNAFICWGTPDELRVFSYWQSCFHKWPGHPYRLENDPHVPSEALQTLALDYAATAPELLEPLV